MTMSWPSEGPVVSSLTTSKGGTPAGIFGWSQVPGGQLFGPAGWSLLLHAATSASGSASAAAERAQSEGDGVRMCGGPPGTWREVRRYYRRRGAAGPFQRGARGVLWTGPRAGAFVRALTALRC